MPQGMKAGHARAQVPRAMIGILGCAVALLLAVLAISPVARAAGRSHVVICKLALGADGGTCFQYAQHPARMESGADGRTVFLKLKWLRWGHGVTTATGLLREDSGPAGHPRYSYSKATMTARRIRSCGTHRAYTRLAISFAGTTIHFRGCGLT